MSSALSHISSHSMKTVIFTTFISRCFLTFFLYLLPPPNPHAAWLLAHLSLIVFLLSLPHAPRVFAHYTFAFARYNNNQNSHPLLALQSPQHSFSSIASRNMQRWLHLFQLLYSLSGQPTLFFIFLYNCLIQRVWGFGSAWGNFLAACHHLLLSDIFFESFWKKKKKPCSALLFVPAWALFTQQPCKS